MQDRPTVALRPVTEEDKEFLRQVYAGTRAAELALIDWDEAQKEAFVRQQFDAQTRHYAEHYQDASRQIVLVDNRPAGRLYLACSPDETRIVDIALLPDFWGQGVGTGILGGVLADAAARGACVTIHVERTNPALRLYARLGFVLVQDRGVYLLLRWPPPGESIPAQPAGSG